MSVLETPRFKKERLPPEQMFFSMRNVVIDVYGP